VLSGEDGTGTPSLARRHFQAYARSALERGILWWAPESRLKRLIQVEPGIPFETLNRPDHPAVPAFRLPGNPGIALVLNSDYSVCTIYARQQNEVVDQALLRAARASAR
jgi:KDO2-lipid IV(A) lauroyltransferase